MRKEENVWVLQTLVNIFVLHQLLVKELLVCCVFLVLGVDPCWHKFNWLWDGFWDDDLEVFYGFFHHRRSLHGTSDQTLECIRVFVRYRQTILVVNCLWLLSLFVWWVLLRHIHLRSFKLTWSCFLLLEVLAVSNDFVVNFSFMLLICDYFFWIVNSIVFEIDVNIKLVFCGRRHHFLLPLHFLWLPHLFFEFSLFLSMLYCLQGFASNFFDQHVLVVGCFDLLFCLEWPVGDDHVLALISWCVRIKHSLSHRKHWISWRNIALLLFESFPVNVLKSFGFKNILANKFNFNCLSQIGTKDRLSMENVQPILTINRMPKC